MKNFDFYKNIITKAAEDSIEDGVTAEPIQYVYDRFKSEVNWNLKQGTDTISVMWHWPLRLAINVPYMNHEILDLAKKANLISQEASKDEEDRFLVMYFPNLARAFFRMSHDMEEAERKLQQQKERQTK